MMGHPMERLDRKVKALAREWLAAGEDDLAARGEIVRRLVRGRNNRHLVAALAIELERLEPYQGDQFVGWMAGQEEAASKRRGK